MKRYPHFGCTRPQLTAATVDILPSRIAQLRQNAPLMQRAGNLFAALP